MLNEENVSKKDNVDFDSRRSDLKKMYDAVMEYVDYEFKLLTGMGFCKESVPLLKRFMNDMVDEYLCLKNEDLFFEYRKKVAWILSLADMVDCFFAREFSFEFQIDLIAPIVIHLANANKDSLFYAFGDGDEEALATIGELVYKKTIHFYEHEAVYSIELYKKSPDYMKSSEF